MNDKCINNTVPPGKRQKQDTNTPWHEIFMRDEKLITVNIDLSVNYNLDGERLEKVNDKLEFVKFEYWTKPSDFTVFIHEMAHAVQLSSDGKSDQQFAIKIENDYREEISQLEYFQQTGKKVKHVEGLIKRTSERALGKQALNGRICTI